MTGESSSSRPMGGSGKQRARMQDGLPPQPPDLKTDDVVIAVMGVTGSGKTTFVNHFADYELEVGHGLDSCTQSVQVVPCTLPGRKRIYLADTPGFDDSLRTDSEILRLVAAWLNQAHKSHIKLTGIVYLHRILDVKVGGSGVKNLRMFKRLCGDDGLKSVCLVTTMWETTSKEIAETRESELQNKAVFWKPMIDQGSKVFRQDSGQTSGLKILKYLIDRKQPVTLDIQREMVDQNLQLGQTGAGAEVASEVEKAKQYYDKRLKELQDELAEALSKQDHDRKEEIEEAKAEFESRIQRGQDELRRMQANSEQLYEEMKQRHEKEMEEMVKSIREKELAIQESRTQVNMLKESHEKDMELQKMRLQLQWKEKYYKMMYGSIGCVVM
ncbi:hypothetical protein K458DRAFT_473787 [Lentithecium fluviatile CBS 122367]|uniref:G domain-containing protein n=1 Tax=Lentithecium fluviatile CBS 122367 TaxID=1168545 RepID=A0A6G1JKB1_9PLEO|nr:hypothetical protein K458DRAFT_473787 [Lentithecium fluviatile CBS 122367]